MILADSIIFPNWHVALVHFPIALVLSGTAIEMFSFLWRRSTVRVAGRWMLLIGALWLLPASMTGIAAIGQAVRDIGNGPAGDGGSWFDVLASHKLPPEGWRLLLWHVWAMGIATIAILTGVLGWLALSDAGRRAWGPALWVIHLVGVGSMSFGAHWAGEATQYWLVMAPRVDSVITLPTSRPALPTPTPAHAYELLALAVPPEQLHTMLAGWVMALGLAAMALALRNANVAAVVQAVAKGPVKSDLAVARPAVADATLPEPLGASRFFILATVGAALATLVGFWVLADSASQWKPVGLWRMVMDPDARRRLAHVVSATLLLVLPIVLAMVSRWATRQRGTLILLSLIYLLAVAVQIYLGLLLALDGTVGGWWFMAA